jgi:DNA-binding HxlR family transcriptional regulator
MMRTIARRISEGGFVLPALAGELGVEQDALGERLFMMERLGFVERRGGCEPAGAPSCRHCAGCCGGTGLPGGVRYTLTEKGRRLAGVPPTKPKED